MNTQLIRVGHSPDPDDAFMFHALANELYASLKALIVPIVQRNAKTLEVSRHQSTRKRSGSP